MADLAAELGWPVLVVAANRLGALNHVLLTVESIRARKLECAGVVLNHPAGPEPEGGQIATATNRGILETLVECPVWEMPHSGVIEPRGAWERLLCTSSKVTGFATRHGG
jgi:dethiobiotin synthetase